MKILKVIFVILIALKTNAQIPNNGFESWKTVGNCIEPTSWFSFYSIIDSTGSYCPVSRSNDHYPINVGSYSVKISNDLAIWNTGIMPDYLLGWGVLSSTKMNDKPLFPVIGHPHSFCGYYKFLPENDDTMNINIYLYKNGVEITNGHLQSKNMTPDWTEFQIIFADTSYYSVDSARILFSASNEPKDGSRGPLGNSVLYMDNLSFDNLITIAPLPIGKIPSRFNLSQNYPNPFNPITRIIFQIPELSFVTLKVYDVLGNEFTTIVNEERPEGNYEIEFNATNLPSGIYFYQLKAGNYLETRKMVLLR